MADRVLAVRRGRAAPLPYRGQLVRSGIVKNAVEGAVAVTAAGLDGDEQADLNVHGGPDKAVYLYAEADYEWWRAELARDIPSGHFGENLTVSGDWVGGVRVGDRFRVGSAVIAATEPREPCFKLGARMGDQGFLKRFREAGRTGFYARVIEEGSVEAGAPIAPASTADPLNPTIAEVHRLYVEGRTETGALTAALRGPDLTAGWRDWMEKRLAEAGEQ